MREARLALALATWIEHNDAAAADVLIRAIVFSVCKRFRMKDDFDDVLGMTWEAILQNTRRNERADHIARQVAGIAQNKARTIVARREARRRTEARWAASETDMQIDLDVEPCVEDELSVLLARLNSEHPDQHDVIALTLSCRTREEARRAWQEKKGRQVTVANFRQMHCRGTRHLRKYWEESYG